MKDISRIDDKLHDIATMSDAETVSISKINFRIIEKRVLIKIFQSDTDGDSDEPEQPRKRFKPNATQSSTSHDTSSSDSN